MAYFVLAYEVGLYVRLNFHQKKKSLSFWKWFSTDMSESCVDIAPHVHKMFSADISESCVEIAPHVHKMFSADMSESCVDIAPHVQTINWILCLFSDHQRRPAS
jgi:hypothetical protein